MVKNYCLYKWYGRCMLGKERAKAIKEIWIEALIPVFCLKKIDRAAIKKPRNEEIFISKTPFLEKNNAFHSQPTLCRP